MKPTLLVLAAGMGSRYGGLKQMDAMGPGGASILEYSVYDAIQAGFGKVVFVIRKDIEEDFKNIVGKHVEPHIEVKYAFQEINTALDWYKKPITRTKPWGTGHAVLAAKQYLTEPFALINADDFYGREAYKVLGKFLMKDCRPDRYAMVGYRLGNTLSENGYVSRGVCSVNGHGYLKNVLERTQISGEGDKIYFEEDGVKSVLPTETLVSMNFWGFHPAVLHEAESQFKAFIESRGEELKSEFYIPSVVNTQLHAKTAKVKVLSNESKWYGVTYTDDKKTVQSALNALTSVGEYPLKLWE
jgi:hypothetical protein